METRTLRIAGLLMLVLALLVLVMSTLQTLAAPHEPGASPLDVVVSEIAWMGTTTSSSDEWVELYNNTAITVDFTGWTFAAGDGPASEVNGDGGVIVQLNPLVRE